MNARAIPAQSKSGGHHRGGERMSWLVWIDKWRTHDGSVIEEAELCFDTADNAADCARRYLEFVAAGESAHVQVVELWNEDNCIWDEVKEVA